MVSDCLRGFCGFGSSRSSAQVLQDIAALRGAEREAASPDQVSSLPGVERKATSAPHAMHTSELTLAAMPRKPQMQASREAGSGRPVPAVLDMNTNVWVDHVAISIRNVPGHMSCTTLEAAARNAFGTQGVTEKAKFRGVVTRAHNASDGDSLTGVFACSRYFNRASIVDRVQAELDRDCVAVTKKRKRACEGVENSPIAEVYFSHTCPGAPKREKHEGPAPSTGAGRWAFLDMCAWVLRPRAAQEPMCI